MGLERLNAGFLLHVLNEQSEFDELNTSQLVNSMDGWWANCIRDNEEREWIGALIKKVRKGDITFTRKMYDETFIFLRQMSSISSFKVRRYSYVRIAVDILSRILGHFTKD